MVLGGGKVFLVEEDAVVALDLKTGERTWRRSRARLGPEPVTYGSYYFTNLCSLVYHDGVVLLMEPDATAETGRPGTRRPNRTCWRGSRQ